MWAGGHEGLFTSALEKNTSAMEVNTLCRFSRPQARTILAVRSCGKHTIKASGSSAVPQGSVCCSPRVKLHTQQLRAPLLVLQLPVPGVWTAYPGPQLRVPGAIDVRMAGGGL